eukprot:gene14731-16266_t
MAGVHFADDCFGIKRDVAEKLGIRLELSADAVPTIDAANDHDPESLSQGNGDRSNRKLLREPEDEDLCTDSAGSVVSGNQDCSECEKKRKIILNLQKKLWHVKRKLKEAQQQSTDTPTVDGSHPPENPFGSEQSIGHEMMDSHVHEEASVDEDTDWAPCEENIVDSSKDQAETKNTIKLAEAPPL